MTLQSSAEVLALIAQEIGTQVIRGPVRYPSESGHIAVDSIDIGEYLYELKDQEVMLIIPPLGSVEVVPVICGPLEYLTRMMSALLAGQSERCKDENRRDTAIRHGVDGQVNGHLKEVPAETGKYDTDRFNGTT